MSLFAFGKRFIKSHPTLLRISSQGFNFIARNRRKINGHSNQIVNMGGFLQKCNIEICGDNNTIIISPKCYLIETSIKIFGNNNTIKLDRQVCAHYGELYIEDDNGEIEIGDNTLITGQTHLAVIEGTKIIIGCDCLFSSNIDLRTGDSHSILDENGKRINKSKDIVVGNHVWIGTKTILLKGSCLADNSILGAGSVLSKAITERNVAVAGNPAQIIKRNINWEKERIRFE